jgi:tRNA dimethylallyltransferase
MFNLKKRNQGRQTIVFLVGPTAVGKSAVAVSLAEKINGEIICCDSMQIYQGIAIASSQPPPLLRKKIRHHLFSIIAPTKEYNVSRYRRQALRKIKEVTKRGRYALLVGGSGLYLSVLVDGIFKVKGQDKSIRRRLYQEVEKFGSSYLHERLSKLDPQAAEKIHPHDAKRIIRALEVWEVTGQPISFLQKQRQGLSTKYEVKIFCLHLPREELYARINARVERMFRQGLVAEVEKLSKLKLSRTAGYAIGIREVKDYLVGKYDLATAKELLKRNTRRYARRQLTWFRQDKRLHWIELGEREKVASAAKRISEVLN